jgi:hypothetical protein
LVTAVALQKGITAITSITTVECIWKDVTDAMHYITALLLNLSDNNLNQSQFNAVVNLINKNEICGI